MPQWAIDRTAGADTAILILSLWNRKSCVRHVLHINVVKQALRNNSKCFSTACALHLSVIIYFRGYKTQSRNIINTLMWSCSYVPQMGASEKHYLRIFRHPRSVCGWNTLLNLLLGQYLFGNTHDRFLEERKYTIQSYVGITVCCLRCQNHWVIVS